MFIWGTAICVWWIFHLVPLYSILLPFCPPPANHLFHVKSTFQFPVLFSSFYSFIMIQVFQLRKSLSYLTFWIWLFYVARWSGVVSIFLQITRFYLLWLSNISLCINNTFSFIYSPADSCVESFQILAIVNCTFIYRDMDVSLQFHVFILLGYTQEEWSWVKWHFYF